MTTRIAGKRVLALILAGGKGSRLGALTQFRAKPALPFAGAYRLIDFALSNCVHSGLSDVWILEQYELHTLNSHLANGRPWDLDRTYGGLQVLPPFTGDGSDEAALAQGNAHALALNAHLIREYAPDVLIVLSADHVYLLDYQKVVHEHLRRGATVTMVTAATPEGETPHRFGNVVADESGRITEFAYKPEKPISDIVTTEVFVYDAPHLLDTLERLKREGDLSDFGHELIPALVQEGRAFEHRFDGYWRDVGTLDAYWEAHQHLLDGKLPRLDDPAWPVLTRSIPRLPARVEDTARIHASLVSPGCVVKGHVERCVLASGVVVEEGATVRDSVVLPGVTVHAGATVLRAVVDEDAVIGPHATVGTHDGLTLVPGRANVDRDTTVTPDDELEVQEISRLQSQ